MSPTVWSVVLKRLSQREQSLYLMVNQEQDEVPLLQVIFALVVPNLSKGGVSRGLVAI